MTVRCYYKILGVSKNVDEKALKKAYRKAALKWHPDKNGSSKEAEANFKDINEAYEVLADPDKRQIYDTYGEEGLKGGVPPQGSGDGNAFGGAGTSFRFSPSDAQSIFAQFFGGLGGMGGGMGGGGMRGRKRKMSPDDDLSSLFGNLGGGGFSGGGFGGQGMGGMPFQQQGQHFDFGVMGGMPFGQQQQQQYQGCQRDDLSVIPPNTLVTIDGLSKTQYNGKRARISSFDPARGRYVCQLHNGHEISLRPANFQQVIDHVRVVGLKSRPDLNGEKGTLVSFNRANDRYVVKLPKGQVEIRPDNLRLPSNTRVRIHGLVSAAKYNNLGGKVVEFDSTRGRYTVLLADGGKLNVKPANLKV